MSEYVNHPVFARIEQLQSAIKNFDSSSLDVQTSENFARFKKVVAFIETLIANSDPELIPKSVLDNINNHLNSCISSFNSFVSNRNNTYLQQSNQYIDNILSAIKPYALYDKKLRQSLRTAIKAYIDEINHHLETVSNTEEEYQRAKDFREKIEVFYDELFEGDDEHQSIKSKIDDLFENIEKKYIEINNFYNEILVDKDDKESIKTEIENAKSEILEDIKETNSKLTEISAKIEELEKFYVKIFGSINEEGLREGGLKQEIEAHLSQLEKLREQQEEIFSSLLEKKKKELKNYEEEQYKKHSLLSEQIEDLLHGATNASLASAYQERKESYLFPIRFWNIVFIVTMAGMFYGGYAFLENIQSWEDMLKHILKYSPLYIPTIWLAIYASKRRSESRALEEEYAHKEALAKSYSSYKKQIDDLGNDKKELMEKLLEKTIDTVSENPSRILDKKHGDNLPFIEIVEKLSGKNEKKS